MGNQFFHIGEEKAENGVDVADAFRRLAETLRGNPNGHEAKQQALTLLRRRDINGVLGETRVEWLKKDISKLQDTESIQTFLVNSSRYMEKEGIAKLSWENLSKYLGQLDQPAQESDEENEMSGTGADGTHYVVKKVDGEWQVSASKNGKKDDAKTYYTGGGNPDHKKDAIGTLQHMVKGGKNEGDFSRRGSLSASHPDDNRQPSQIAKNMPDAVKLKDAHPQDIESHWQEMDETQRMRVAKEAGFNEVESRELAKLAWEGLDPSIKKDLSWVLNADPEHLPSKDDFEEAEAKAAAKSAAEDEAQEDLDNLIKKEMDAAVQSFAEARAAESWSRASDGMIEDYGKDVHVTAEFGEWLAVNGALIMPGKDIPQPPAGFRKTKFGGAIPDFEVEVQMESVKDFISREMKFPREMVERVALAEYPAEVVSVTVSGKSEVFAKETEAQLNESVEEFQKGGWSQDRTDGVWSKKVGKKSGAAFPSHADAFGTHLWSVYDGNKLIGRGEAKTDKEAMSAADAHLSAEPVPIGEVDGETLHTQLSTAAKKAVPEADPFDIEAAIYWFASDNYRGMGDPLYGVLSLSKFKPGPTHTSVSDEGETAEEIYNHLKDKFAKTETEDPETNVRPMTIDPKTRRQANAYLSELSSKYWPGVPLFDIAETLKEKFGIEVEDSIVTGEQGRDTFELKKGGMPIKNSMLALSWFKMPVSGKYEITAYLSE
jgi:hypothetical protein